MMLKVRDIIIEDTIKKYLEEHLADLKKSITKAEYILFKIEEIIDGSSNCDFNRNSK